MAIKDGKTGFYKAEADTYIPSGKAYLEIANAGVKAIYFGGDETGIEAISNGEPTMDNAIYDLSGRRVEKATKKGIYIINGKKVLK